MSTNINFIETDAGRIYDLVMSALEGSIKEPLYPGDERRIFGEGFVSVVVALFNKVNDEARQSLLRYARGSVLDAMGERVSTPRHEPAKSEVTLRFSANQPITRNTVIPHGTRATPDSTLYFEIIEAAVLYAGSTFVDVAARATVGGTAGNGYRPGSVITMVDLVPLIGGVQNIDETHGGDDGEPYDETGDNNYRGRIQLAPAGFSTAGPESAYQYHALSADPGIRDVRIVSDQHAGTVDIIILMNNGEGPDADVAARVLAAANDNRVRPMNDLVSVASPDFVSYDIRLKYYVTAKTAAATIQTIEGAEGAIARYIQWQGGTIGRDINPDKLRALILSPHWDEGLTGALRVDVIEPQRQELGDRQVARFSGTAIVEHGVVKE